MGMNPQRALWQDASLLTKTEGARYLMVRLPAFRLERCGFGADELVALVAERQNATRVVACTPEASKAGLREGMTAAEARALVAGVVLEPLDEVGEEADLADLVRCLDPLCDRVRVFGDDELVLEVSRCVPVFGSEQVVMQRVRSFVEELGHYCILALSDHPGASAALVRTREGDTLVPVGEVQRALASVSIRAVRASAELFDALRAIGMRTLGQYANLDAASVSGRFGEEGVELYQLATGVPAAPWGTLPLPSRLGRLHLDVEDDLIFVDELMRAVVPGLERLRRALESQGEVATLLELRLDLDRGSPLRIRLRLGRATRDVAVLEELLRKKLERVELDAPVVGMTLHAPETCRPLGQQEDLLTRREAVESLPELLVRLSETLGEQAVLQVERVDNRRPEGAWRSRPVHASPGPPPPKVVDDPSDWQEGASWRAVRPRPSLLRRVPRPIRVRDRDGVPIALRTARGWVPLMRVDGPEILEGDWWHDDGGYSRRYWVVEVPGRVLWLFEERESWYLHGWFD